MQTSTIWANSQVVKEYVTNTSLQKPEQTILNSIAPKLKHMRMLDIGIGGGRTTHHFADLVKEYIGSDFVPEMVTACKEKFSANKNITFKIADVRDLSQFKTSYFDLVLFSFNGLDCLTKKEERQQAIQEIKQVLAPNGLFIFSSHNINAVDKIYSIQPSKNPIKILQRILKFALIPFFNGPKKSLKAQDSAIIRDGLHQFRIKLFYIKPQTQVQQLTELGFTDIQAFSLENGAKIKEEDLAKVDDYWIYYTCRKA